MCEGEPTVRPFKALLILQELSKQHKVWGLDFRQQGSPRPGLPLVPHVPSSRRIHPFSLKLVPPPPSVMSPRDKHDMQSIAGHLGRHQTWKKRLNVWLLLANKRVWYLLRIAVSIVPYLLRKTVCGRDYNTSHVPLVFRLLFKLWKVNCGPSGLEGLEMPRGLTLGKHKQPPHIYSQHPSPLTHTHSPMYLSLWLQV